MTMLGPLLESFFVDHLYRETRVCPNTVASYRDSFRLLLSYAHRQLGKAPQDLTLTHVDAPLIGSFLNHLETDRGCEPQSRNVRLSAIRSFFRYTALREPAHAGHIQRVLALRGKKCDKNLVDYLARPEMEALINAPDTTTWLGRRDRALLVVGMQTGLRVSELIALCPEQVVLGEGPHIRCRGKGRKERCVPLTRRTVSALASWMAEEKSAPTQPIFRTRRGAMSRDAVEALLKRHIKRAASVCASLVGKRISPHVMRHTAAMRMLEDGVDITMIALIFGHESVRTTFRYLHSDLTMKAKALARTYGPSSDDARRYLPGDRVMAFLNGL